MQDDRRQTVHKASDHPVRIGLPRTMIYYYLYPYFAGFFDSLGLELITSSPTTQDHLDHMKISPTDELCVPVKLTFAHAQELREAGASHLLIPSLVSLDPHNFCCPKFIGLPMMVGRAAGFAPDEVLRPVFNYREDPSEHLRQMALLAHRLGVHDVTQVGRALDAAETALDRFHRLTRDEQLTVPEALRRMFGRRQRVRRRLGAYNPLAKYDPDLRIGVIGHPYVMYDLLGQYLVERVREYGRVITPEMVDPNAIRTAAATIYQGERMWTFEGEKLGAALHLMREKQVDRLILIGPFGCGPQSVMENFIMAEAERQGLPFLHLTVDEQTGEAGLVTRLEAFMDTRRTNSVSPASRSSMDTGELSPSNSVARGKAPVRGPEPHRPVVGTPSMGLIDVAVKTALEVCGVEVLPTPRLTQDLIDRGRQLAPEFICYPLVGVTGQIEALLNKGADTIAMITGKGRCRAGWYGQVQKVLLKRAGYDFDMVLIDSPAPFQTNWQPFKEAIHRLTGGRVGWPKVAQGILFGYQKMAAIDRADEITRELRAYERAPGTGDNLFQGLVRQVQQASSVLAVRRSLREFAHAAREVPRIQVDPLKVQVLGEIYVVLEPFINRNIEKILAGSARTRVHVVRELTASAWFAQHVLQHPGLLRRYREVAAAASPYVDQHLGGHGTEDVGLTVMAPDDGIDGVVHLVPFTCMPELVAQNLLTHVSRDRDISVLSLVISEQTGEAGFVTRVEAFLETLVQRRRKSGLALPLASI